MPLDGVKNLLLILSGKGGVGKSSATLQLALALTLQGKSVGILDIDLTGPSIPRLVGLEDAKIKQSKNGWLPVPVHPALPAEPINPNATTDTDTPTEVRGSLRCMSLGFLIRERSDAVIWRGPKKTAMIKQFMDDAFWGDTDYLLVDTPPGTGDEHIGLAENLLTMASTDPAVAAEQKIPRLAGAVLITTPQAVATSDVRKEVNFCVKTSIPTLGVIENMCGYACPCCGEVTNLFSSGGGEVMAAEMGVRFLGRVPVDVKFGAMVEGKPEELSDDEETEEKNGDKAEDKAQNGEAANGEADDRPLVEKYKDCFSYSRYEGFAKELISIIEGNGATAASS